MHKPTPVLFDNQARAKILKGVNVVYEAVRRTMGPQGGNALIYGLYSRPYRLTNDGYTVADIIELKDPHENLAANAIQDAAKRTNLLAGDGTTCTVVVTGKGVNTILPMISSMNETADLEKALASKGKKRGVMDIKHELFATKDEVVAKLKEMSRKVESLEELTRIAVVSVENEEYGKIIAEMAWKVGTGGYIDILEGFKGEVETEMIEGARFPAKIPAKVFVNKLERYEMEIVDTPVLLTNYIIDRAAMATIVGNLQGLQKLVIIAPDFKDSGLVAMANVNKKHNDLIYAPVKVPSLKTVQFEDVEVFTGARFINKDNGDKLTGITASDLGFLAKLIVKDADIREDCIALGGKGALKVPMSFSAGEVMSEAPSPVEMRIKTLKEQLEATREEGQKNLLRRRIAGLASAVGIIRVSCDSEAETYYWKKKIEDAVYACKAALEEGYIRGGGLALKEIAEGLPEDNLLRPALLAPYEQIQENAERIEVGEDIIDPTKAIRCAVEHSVSIMANLATVRVIIPEEREKSPAEGYEAIARAIHQYVLMWAREKNIIQENEDEIARDEMTRHDAILRSIVD